MNSSHNDEILVELRRIEKLLLLIATKNQKQKEQVRLLDSMGFQPKEIGELLGITANAARVALHSVRKKGKPKKIGTEQPDT
jgi:DNA-directed RNA polymerase specialized sigma24 family protein